MIEKADLDSWVMLQIGIVKKVTDLSVVMIMENLIIVARRLSMENHIEEKELLSMWLLDTAKTEKEIRQLILQIYL